jgi:hypothetical protein
MPQLPWIAAACTFGLLAAGLGVALWRQLRPKPAKSSPLPTRWALTSRPVFSTDERRAYRVLREALPHAVLLCKLPLVRFCQPTEPAEVRYWYQLLGSHHVTFAICSANGRVLAVIDLDSERANSRRALQIKQSVLSACRVRYLRCAADHLPSMAELQLLVPQPGGPGASPLHSARDTLASTVATRRAERSALWQDSTVFHDSFFAPDSRGFASSEHGALSSGFGRLQPSGFGVQSGAARAPDNEIVGVVVDRPQAFVHSRQ